MSNTHIREAVQSVVTEKVGRVPAGYEGVVDAVIEKMEALAESAADSIRSAASGVASSSQVEEVLVSAGLVTPEAPTSGGDDDDLSERIGKVEALCNRLVEAARRRGITV